MPADIAAQVMSGLSVSTPQTVARRIITKVRFGLTASSEVFGSLLSCGIPATEGFRIIRVLRAVAATKIGHRYDYQQDCYTQGRQNVEQGGLFETDQKENQQREAEDPHIGNRTALLNFGFCFWTHFVFSSLSFSRLDSWSAAHTLNTG